MDERDSQTSDSTGEQSSQEASLSVGLSDVTLASSISENGAMPNSIEESTENKLKTINNIENPPNEVIKDGQQVSTEGVEKEDERDKPPADPDTGSDSRSDESIARKLARKLEMFADSETLFETYKLKLDKTAQKKGQDSTLVEGLIDYLRVMESRMSKVEAGLPKNEVPDSDDSTPTPSCTDDKSIELTVKFFNAAAYFNKEESYPVVGSETEKGTFGCNHDTQHLIRVLYSKARGSDTRPQKEADIELPNASSIEITTFGVSSEAISTFFAKQLDIEADSDHLIGFGKPFKPLLRNLGPVREQLKKLKTVYGQVRSSGMNESETPDAVPNDGGDDALPFPPTDISGADSIPAFERPTALPHFQVFLDFVDEYLGDQIELYERLRDGKEQHVSFENLWMLFDVNDTIICPLREAGAELFDNMDGYDHSPIRRYNPQAYRVVATSGGMPLVRTMAPAFQLKGGSNPAAPPLSNPPLAPGPETGDQVIPDMVLQPNIISRKVRDSYTELRVYCYYVDFNGVEYGTVREVFIFKPFEREMEIRNLHVCPSRYMPDNQLHDRGKTFLNATSVSHMQYEGLTAGTSREEINSPVVVDLKLAFESGPELEKASIAIPTFRSPTSLWLSDTSGEARSLFGASICSQRWCWGCKKDVYIDSQKKQREKIESDLKLVFEEYESEKKRGEEGLRHFGQLMEKSDLVRLLPGTVPGFALRNRKWVLLHLKQLRPVQQNNEWDKLVLPPGHREMVQAMVETHAQELGSNKDPDIGMDLVQGKGRGCIILLHGVPGVGKTSTAECVAAHTKKPLYPITCGDIGYSPEDVERNMENHFKLAHKWGCVLLLDEADVFLAKRDQKDIQRNGLVSVFLRILEYYSGILFLTTNRVGAIDDAFRSRLHLTLYYPKLTKKQTQKIFKTNFERITEINSQREKNGLSRFTCKDTERERIMEWSKKKRDKLKWNGRQIRNTFQTVLALSEFNARLNKSESQEIAITKNSFKVVANASIQFDEYLLATHGADEDRIAKREFMRAPVDFSPSNGPAFTAFGKNDSETSDDDSDDEEDGDESSSESENDSDDSDESSKEKRSKKKKSKGAKGNNKKSKSSGKKGKKGKSDKKV